MKSAEFQVLSAELKDRPQEDEVSCGLTELYCNAIELSGNAIELSGDAIELSGDAVELSGDAVELSGDANTKPQERTLLKKQLSQYLKKLIL